MKLWYMNSKVLEGFYRSEVYAIGANKEEAITAALLAYDRWVEYQLDTFGGLFIISESFPDDPNHKKQLQVKRNEFIQELKDELKQLEHFAQIDVSS